MHQKGILILGGTGFVGRQLIHRLLQKKIEVYVIAGSAYTLPRLPGLHNYSDSLDNEELLKQILPLCHTVFHLASNSTPGTSSIQPTFEASNNLLPTLRFLDILHQFKDVSLIYFSSGGAIYGNPDKSPVTEQCPTNPLSYYGAGKAAIEKFIIAFCQQSQHHATILRPSNFYGPEQPFRRGFGIIPTIFHHILTDQTLTLWGDGSNSRDYLYIDDIIDLCIKLIESPNKNTDVKIFNVGSGLGTTLNDLCDIIEEVSNTKIKRRYIKSRTVDVQSIVLDCTKLQKAYNWHPGINLETGLSNTWQWFKTQKQ
ncbi:NAD-dependent epimerase/dehydratase family protein [bacterium]|nr:NAD-dependent epimerase/dehydratase family protein [bacterium]